MDSSDDESGGDWGQKAKEAIQQQEQRSPELKPVEPIPVSALHLASKSVKKIDSLAIANCNSNTNIDAMVKLIAGKLNDGKTIVKGPHAKFFDLLVDKVAATKFEIKDIENFRKKLQEIVSNRKKEENEKEKEKLRQEEEATRKTKEEEAKARGEEFVNDEDYFAEYL
eukprot:GEMP01051209.1.p1 GENE.GEMP01051209.1~~GEMP01051209.1.p1  ORF type:complete len:197 (+),score=38.16 GEMP01051209.1:88-591(+)